MAKGYLLKNTPGGMEDSYIKDGFTRWKAWTEPLRSTESGFVGVPSIFSHPYEVPVLQQYSICCNIYAYARSGTKLKPIFDPYKGWQTPSSFLFGSSSAPELGPAQWSYSRV